MIIPLLPDIFLLDEPTFAAPDEILVADPAPMTAVVLATAPTPSVAMEQQAAGPDPMPDAVAADPATAAPAPRPVVEATPVTDAVAAEPTTAAPAPLPVVEPASAPEVVSTDPTPSPPAFDVPPEDAFPSLADLDAILAANAGPPPSPDLAEREALLALLGLDPAIAADPDLYDATIAALHDPDADQVLADWMKDAGIDDLTPECPDVVGDWHLG